MSFGPTFLYIANTYHSMTTFLSNSKATIKNGITSGLSLAAGKVQDAVKLLPIFPQSPEEIQKLNEICASTDQLFTPPQEPEPGQDPAAQEPLPPNIFTKKIRNLQSLLNQRPEENPRSALIGDRQRTDTSAQKFIEYCSNYCLAMYLHKTIDWRDSSNSQAHASRQESNDSIYITIATSVNSERSLWQAFSREFPNLTLLERIRLFGHYTIMKPLIENLVKDSTNNIIETLRNGLRDGNFGQNLDSVIAHVNNFALKYLEVIASYSDQEQRGTLAQRFQSRNGDNQAGKNEYFFQHLRRDSFNKLEPQEEGYTQSELHSLFSNLAVDHFYPDICWSQSILSKAKLSHWKPESFGEEMAKALSQLFIAYPVFGFLALLVFLIEKLINRIGRSMATQYGPSLIKELAEKGVGQIGCDAYTRAINTFLCNQLKKILPIMQSSKRSKHINANLIPEQTQEKLRVLGKHFLDLLKAQGIKQDPLNEQIIPIITDFLENNVIQFFYHYYKDSSRRENLLQIFLNLANLPFIPRNEGQQQAPAPNLEQTTQQLKKFLQQAVNQAVDSSLGPMPTHEKSITDILFQAYDEKVAPILERALEKLDELTDEADQASFIPVLRAIHEYLQTSSYFIDNLSREEFDQSIKEEVNQKISDIAQSLVSLNPNQNSITKEAITQSLTRIREQLQTLHSSAPSKMSKIDFGTTIATGAVAAAALNPVSWPGLIVVSATGGYVGNKFLSNQVKQAAKEGVDQKNLYSMVTGAAAAAILTPASWGIRIATSLVGSVVGKVLPDEAKTSIKRGIDKTGLYVPIAGAALLTPIGWPAWIGVSLGGGYLGNKLLSNQAQRPPEIPEEERPSRIAGASERVGEYFKAGTSLLNDKPFVQGVINTAMLFFVNKAKQPVMPQQQEEPV